MPVAAWALVEQDGETYGEAMVAGDMTNIELVSVAYTAGWPAELEGPAFSGDEIR